ncbi:MAG: O-antigen ligase family protein [Deltaproteobacteria bacterium]|nr:O-antigen ligase family protein [Deltaproteobacteria bacterium]
MLRTRQWVKGITIAVVVSVIGGLTIVALAPKTFTDRMGGIQDYEEDESALGRLDAWGAGLRMLKDRPLLGVGAGAFSDAYGRKYKPFDAVAANWREAHSLYVQTFSELGVTGFGLLLGLFFLMFRDQRRVHQYALKDPQTQKEIHFFGDALTTGLVGLLVSGAFLSVLYYPHIYILSAMTMILLRVAQDFSRADHALEEETARAR